MTTEEIRARLAELTGIISTLATLEGDLDEQQRSDWDDSNTEYDQLAGKLAEREERTQRYASLASTQVETGDGAEAAGAARTTFNQTRDPGDIFDRSNLSVTRDSDGMEWRDRAMRAIDGWRGSPAEYKESASKLVDQADLSLRDRQVADHILTFGHPLYQRAFTKYLRGGVNGMSMMDRDEAGYWAEANQRALNEGTAAAGQAIVPPFLDPTIILTNSGTNNPFRQISTVKTITTQTWKGVTSAGVTAEWTAEATEMTDASPTFVQPTITPIRADAYIQASFEMIEDTDIATSVAMLFADARDRLEGTAFAVGTGSTQPYGVVTELQLVTASRTSATTNASLGAVDIFTLDSNLTPRHRDNASFVANKGIINVLRGLATGPSQAQSAFWVDFGGAVPSKLIGYPIYSASGMQSSLSAATASSDDVVVLGDFRNGYYIVDRIGMSIAYNPLVLGSNRRPTGEVGWAAFWRVGARVVDATAFQMLRV